jgi:hypothetical protein
MPSRRQALLGIGALCALPMLAGGHRVFAAPMAAAAPALNPELLARAMAAREQHIGRIANPDRIALVDFSQPSRDPRFTILDIASGQGVSMLVAHGRGSDPMHSGWLEQFSNEHGSLASSRGAYLSAIRYTGMHGDSQRLIGLDPDNANAEARAIVIHPADYVSKAIIDMQGKLGRSEGCFALCRDDIAMALALLGEGTLLFADRV